MSRVPCRGEHRTFPDGHCQGRRLPRVIREGTQGMCLDQSQGGRTEIRRRARVESIRSVKGLEGQEIRNRPGSTREGGVKLFRM